MNEKKVWTTTWSTNARSNKPSSASLSLNNIPIQISVNSLIGVVPGFQVRTGSMMVSELRLIRKALNDFWVEHKLED